MDYPLHYSDNHTNNHTPTSSLSNSSTNNNNSNTSNASFRTYGVFDNRSDLMLFNSSNSSTSPSVDPMELNEDRSRSMLLMSTRPSIPHDPWNPQHHHQQHLHPILNEDYAQPTGTIQNLHHNFSHNERGIAGFVSKLYQCLQSTDSNQKYARWCQHNGKDMFIIDCIPEFTEIILPRLFKHCKFPSFVRQLNIYGFQRDTDARKSKDTRDKESCRWYHPCFRPGRRDLFHLIRRKATRYSRKKRVKAEEDPETILNLGSGDESDAAGGHGDDSNIFSADAEDENIVLHINQDDSTNDQLCSSSASSVTHSVPLEYNAMAPLESTTTNTNSTTANNNNNNNNNNLLLIEDTSSHTPSVIPEDLDTINSSRIELHHSNAINENTTITRENELRLQLYHMKRHSEEVQTYFEEQLRCAQIKIDGQRLRIQQLEETLRITKQPNLKLNTTAPNGYMCTTTSATPGNSSFNNYLHLSHSPSSSSTSRLVSQQRSPYDLNLNKNEVSTPRPTITPDEEYSHSNHNFYFAENNKIARIKSENDRRQHALLHSTPPPPLSASTNDNNSGNENAANKSSTSSWGPFTHHQHRDTFHKTNSIAVATAGSSTTESILENNESGNSNNHRTNKTTTLPIHMNFNSFM